MGHQIRPGLCMTSIVTAASGLNLDTPPPVTTWAA